MQACQQKPFSAKMMTHDKSKQMPFRSNKTDARKIQLHTYLIVTYLSFRCAYVVPNIECMVGCIMSVLSYTVLILFQRNIY